MANSPIRVWLERGIPARLVQVEQRLLNDLEKAFEIAAGQMDGGASKGMLLLQLVDFVKQFINEELNTVATLRQRNVVFTQRFSRASTEEERRQHILELASDLGAGPRQLAADRRAFKRWFGQDAVSERYQRCLIETERKIAFCLGRLGAWAAAALDEYGEMMEHRLLWRRIDMEVLVKPLLAYDGDTRVRIAAFKCLSSALQHLPAELQGDCVSDNTLQYVFRSALERRQEVWIQTEALSLLESLSANYLATVLRRRLETPAEGDDFFVRRRVVSLLCVNLEKDPDLAALIDVVLLDPSSAVRQSLAESLGKMPLSVCSRYLPLLAKADSSVQVRAAAILQVSALVAETKLFEPCLATLHDVLSSESSSFVLRVAFKVACEGHEVLVDQGDKTQTGLWMQTMASAIEHLHINSSSLAVRRWAAQARERLWCQNSQKRRNLYLRLQQQAEAIRPGQWTNTDRRLFSEFDEETLGRVWSVIAQEDYGFNVVVSRWRPRVTRGHKFGFRSWRFLHELRRSATDKRQGVSHTTGRIFYGTVRIPSSILCELAETKVPGEPLHISSESGWRPYLPLVDEVISCLDEGIMATPVRFYTSEGITELIPPRSLVKRISARTMLTTRFSNYADLRNWQEGGQSSAETYIKALRALGFDVTFRPYAADELVNPKADPAVKRFFPAVIPFAESDFPARLQDYFFSVYENSLTDLSLFLAAASSFFAGRHLYVNYQLRRVRAGLPLVIGGWGTRGKSGTERLKAALFNGLGYGVVSKTTGCEAMFLHAPAYGKLREMFLFRPYDKATIWEQANVMRIAQQLDVEVFLWECMALTPSYVSVLQQEWVKDDISTITNTYPDHEDLQGPAGINIPEVMSNFVPKSSLLLTSEEQMLPILRTAAQAKKTRLQSVTWLEAGLLSDDMLNRFPYEEHPYNIALVLAMANEMGVDRDFALKEMADRVVADLGVLKAYPVSLLKGRELEFINGMSANERFGCLNNWQRMGFADQDWQNEPGVWLSTVVNNRADRVSRSQVFADILVEDLAADCHFLIGTNLEGLLGYIEESWQRYAASISLWPESGGEPTLILRQLAQHLRLPHREEHVVARLRVMLTSLSCVDEVDTLLTYWNNPDSLKAALQAQGLYPQADTVVCHLKQYYKNLVEFQDFEARVAAVSSPNKALDKEMQGLMKRWFQRKLVVLEDPNLLGDQIIDRICDETPPGMRNRIMGIQNIKGTGLDFIYRWQAWQVCHNACADLQHEDQRIIDQGLLTLVNFREYGVLSEQYLRQVVEAVRHVPMLQNESRQAQLQVIISNLEECMKQVRARSISGGSVGVVARIATAIEAFLDAGDAVKRRKTADRVYQDLIDQRIGHERAAIVLQDLNKRQKGGWLARQVYAVLSRISRRK